MQVVNVAAYKFVEIPEPQSWLLPIRQRCDELNLKGNIVLAPEGINFSLAGEPESIDSILDFLRHDSLFENRFLDIEIKESFSSQKPFGRMVVRAAKEIITLRQSSIRPGLKRAPSVLPLVLKKWIEQGHDDDGREIVLLDARNDFEVEIGTFENAIELGIQRFSEFPEAFAKIEQEQIKDKTIVSFCTGGVRCEKSVLYLEELGLPHVYQLEGGILRYFEEAGGAHWQNECFVFDERVALEPSLEASKKEFPKRSLGSSSKNST